MELCRWQSLRFLPSDGQDTSLAAFSGFVPGWRWCRARHSALQFRLISQFTPRSAEFNYLNVDDVSRPAGTSNVSKARMNCVDMFDLKPQHVERLSARQAAMLALRGASLPSSPECQYRPWCSGNLSVLGVSTRTCKRKKPMKIHVLVAVVTLSVFVPTIVFAQSLESGALLSIQSADGSLRLSVYDSQIHSGLGVSSSPCDQGVVTDAYVLQGGSPTGCDPGDAYETSQTPGVFEFAGTGYKFDLKTFYQFGGCNTSGTICANPDTGFLTVTNNGTSSFAGTITLSGNSSIGGPPYCAPGGMALDTWTAGLAPGASVTLALSPDSSNCGGFNAPQTQTLNGGGTVIFPVGTDDYQLAGLDNAGGEQISILPIPVLQSLSNPGSNASNTFNPGALFSTFSCAPYGDFSEVGNPECIEFQLTCAAASDCEQFLYTATTHYSFPPGFPGIGGPGFLKASGQSCPSSLFDKNILSFYTQDTTHRGGGGGLSCFVAAFTPGDPIVTSFSSFVGFQAPVSDTQINFIHAPQAVPLGWQQFLSPNIPLTNLTFCSSPNPATGSCTVPWVNLGTIPITCPGGKPVHSETETTISAAGNSGLQNFGNGLYQFNWKTVKGSTGCVIVVATFDSGLTVYPATFQYK